MAGFNTYAAVGGENQLSNEGRIFYRMDLIQRLLPFLPMLAEGQKRTVPGRSGGWTSNQIQWRQFASLSLATTPLTEGVPPTGKNLSVSTVSANLSQYGDIVKVTDVLVGASIDDVAREAQDLLAEQAGQTLHALLMTELKNNTTTQIANGKAARTDLLVGDVINAYEIKKAVRTLHRNKVPRFPDGFYHGLLHPDSVFDLSNDSEWIDVTTMGGMGGESRGAPSLVQYAERGYVGKFHNVLFRMSTDAPQYSTPTSFGALIFGPNWFGLADFVGMTMKDINAESGRGIDVSYIPPTTREKVDPLGQFGIAGWKVAFVAKILDNARAVILHHGATA